MLVTIASPWHYELPVLKFWNPWRSDASGAAHSRCKLSAMLFTCASCTSGSLVAKCKVDGSMFHHAKCIEIVGNTQKPHSLAFPVSKLTRWDTLGWGQQWGHWHSIYLFLKSSILSANLILLQFSICGYSNEVSLEARAFTDLNVMNKFHRMSDVKTYETLGAKLAKQFILLHLSGPTWARNVP